MAPNQTLPKHFEIARNATTLAGKHAATSGWMDKTLKGYSSGVSKFIEFKEKTSGAFNEDQPVSDEDIYEFIAWAGQSRIKRADGPDRVISSVTIKKYLDGIRAWNMVRHMKKPSADADMVAVLIRATKRNEEEKTLITNKQPIMIRELYKLFKGTYGKSDELNVVGSVALIAFWGMARLGVLLRSKPADGALLRRHIEFGEKDGKRYAKLHLRKAKTAKAEEVQIIHLQEQFNVLDPVAALERVLALNNSADRDDLIFATPSSKGMKALTKPRFMKLAGEIWGKAGLESWSGHSFRVGGASIRFNLGTPVKRIALQGRWKSLTYLRYFKAYSEEEKKDTITFLETIDERN